MSLSESQTDALMLKIRKCKAARDEAIARYEDACEELRPHVSETFFRSVTGKKGERAKPSEKPAPAADKPKGRG